MLLAATLEDAVEAHDRPNVPGTIDQRPNWSLPLPVPLEDLADDPRVGRLAAILSAATVRAAPEAERKS
jgi:4-alpha-glucanotransferase